jgi:hypothetical protein
MSGTRRRGVRLPGLDSPGNAASAGSVTPDVALDSGDDDPVECQLPRGTVQLADSAQNSLALFY